MPFTHLPFVSLDWTAGAHPLETKKLVEGQPVVLLEFAPGFEDPNWCERGHIIYVLDGVLDLVLDDRTERIAAGDGCRLDPTTRHRAKNPGNVPVRLFVVSDCNSVLVTLAKATRTQSMKTPDLMRLRMRPFVRAERVAPTSSGEPLAAHDLY